MDFQDILDQDMRAFFLALPRKEVSGIPKPIRITSDTKMLINGKIVAQPREIRVVGGALTNTNRNAIAP